MHGYPYLNSYDGCPRDHWCLPGSMRIVQIKVTTGSCRSAPAVPPGLCDLTKRNGHPMFSSVCVFVGFTICSGFDVWYQHIHPDRRLTVREVDAELGSGADDVLLHHVGSEYHDFKHHYHLDFESLPSQLSRYVEHRRQC